MEGLPLELIAEKSSHKGTKREWMGRIGRTQAAALLSQLAAQVAEGRLETAQGELVLPEDLVVEVELKTKPTGQKLEVELKWTTPQVDRAGAPMEAGLAAAPQLRPPEPPATFAEAKSDLKAVWKLVLEPLKQGRLPEPGLVERLERLTRASADLADPAWRSGMEELASGLDELRSAVAAGDLATARAAASHVDRLRQMYHRRFK